MSDSDSVELTPPELKEKAESVISELLPEKSKARYEVQYNSFKTWCSEKGVKTYSENVMIAYFTELVSSGKKSLWCIYSMLKSCMILYENIDISKYSKLGAYLKRKTANYKPKKSKILEEENVNIFIEQAPDEKFFLMKVVLIIGISGACRREELYKMVLNDIEVKDDILLIRIPITKTNISRSFVISKSNWVKKVQKYLDIRANNPVGINTIGSIPSKIAAFLNLEDPTSFSGHCFRRSSATLLANKGGDLLSLKRFGGWKSSNVAEGYVAESLKRKIQVAELLTEAGPSTSKRSAIANTGHVEQAASSTIEVEVEDSDINLASNVQANQLIPGLFSHVENCSINVNIYNNCVIEKKL